MSRPRTHFAAAIVGAALIAGLGVALSLLYREADGAGFILAPFDCSASAVCS